MLGSLYPLLSSGNISRPYERIYIEFVTGDSRYELSTPFIWGKIRKKNTFYIYYVCIAVLTLDAGLR